MWTTPAPPSTAFVAASIWSGTGDVKTSPGHAASSMPAPTKPPCIGSCPAPPPEMIATLPVGASLRTTIWFSKSTRTRSGCAAARPASDSLTTSAGSLMNFFITCVAIAIFAPLPRWDGFADAGAVGLGDGSLDRASDLPWCRHPVVGEARERRADQVCRDVREELLRPVVHSAVDRRDEERADRARWVQRCIRDRTDGDDDRDDDKTDHEPGPAFGRACIDDAEDREQQDPRADRLDEHRRAPARRRVVEVDDAEAVAEVDRPRSEGAPHGQRSGHAAGDLRRPVLRHLTPREALRRRKRERDRRVDVAARDLPDRVDERHDDQAEGHRDEAEVGSGERRLRAALEQQDRRHGAGADEDEQCRADDLGEEALRNVVLRH